MTPLHRPPIVCNRFEVVLLILLSFIVSTRLIWLQIDERPPLISDEFFATATTFKGSLGHFCSKGIETPFPNPSTFERYMPVSVDIISPGLEGVFWGMCNINRLTISRYMDQAPLMIGLTAFLVAVTARLLTSNWVGGFIAASVVLSRGSILQGTHLASTAYFVQFLAGLVMLLTSLYLRTRDARWLPVSFVIAIFAILMNPIFSILMTTLTIFLLYRTLHQSMRSHFSVHRFRLHLLSILSMMLIVPSVIFALKIIMPSSTGAISIVLRQLGVVGSTSTWSSFAQQTFVTWIDGLKSQDFHFQASLGVIALAATWKRYLPRGSGFWALTITCVTLISLLVDGCLRDALMRFSDSPAPLELKITGAVSPLEPLVIGTAAAFVWFAVRSLTIAIFPSYSSSSFARGTI